MIKDDGQGFQPEQPLPGHYGLLYMREQAVSCGRDVSRCKASTVVAPRYGWNSLSRKTPPRHLTRARGAFPQPRPPPPPCPSRSRVHAIAALASRSAPAPY